VVAEALIERAGEDTDPGQRERLADALVSKGTALLADERWEEAVEASDEVIDRFQDAGESGLRHSIALALYSKATALDRLGRGQESEGVIEDMLSRFGEEALAIFEGAASNFANAPEAQQREVLASALYAKAMALHKLGRQHEAVPVLTELIERFQDDQDPEIQDVVLQAREAHEEMGDGESE
jgi:tetratricopeptide (TPR) repeat protein